MVSHCSGVARRECSAARLCASTSCRTRTLKSSSNHNVSSAPLYLASRFASLSSVVAVIV
jgi:hypothetical protein